MYIRTYIYYNNKKEKQQKRSCCTRRAMTCVCVSSRNFLDLVNPSERNKRKEEDEKK